MALDEEILRFPDPSTVAFYETNEAEVLRLQAVVATGPEVERSAAFQELALSFPLAAEITARGLTTDPDDSLALAAIDLLKGVTVMSDHGPAVHTHTLPASTAYMMAQHEASLEALRAALLDDRREVREAVASFLASLSDPAALAAIAAGSDSGLYAEVEAANLYTLASGEVGQRYLEQFLGAGDLDAQRTAIGYLGAIPDYQDRIRTAYFVNPDAPTEARTDAARTLSTFDTAFPTYALIVASEPGVDPMLYQAALRGYVTTLGERGELDPASAQNLSQQLDAFRAAMGPGSISEDLLVDFESLAQRLEAVSGVEQ